MPFINVDLGTAKEAELVPEGKYHLRCVKSDDRESKKGNPITVVSIRVEDHDFPNAQLITHVINYPTRDTPDDQRQMRVNEIARFLKCFNIPGEANGFNTDDIAGAEGECLVEQEEGEDKVVRNKLRLPRLDQ